jgi:hypothetical protein
MNISILSMFTFSIHTLSAYKATVAGNASIFPMAHGTRHRHHANHFDQSDLPTHMLGLATSRAPLRNWFVFAILTAAALALALVAIGNFIF